MNDYFVFNGKSSRDFDVYLYGEHTFGAPQREVETITVPGRNGDLSIDKGRYENISFSYPAIIINNVSDNIAGLRDFLLAQRGYCRLEDTIHPEEFVMARFSGNFEPDIGTKAWAGKFEIKFDRAPQRFLKDGERVREYPSGTVIRNYTNQNALPLIRAYGTGSLTLNETIAITSAINYTDIDCEAQEAFKGAVNCNQNLTLSTGKFPYFKPGNNTLTYSGFTRVEITPRWWHL